MKQLQIDGVKKNTWHQLTLFVTLHIPSNFSKLCNLLTPNWTMPSLGWTHHVVWSWFADICKNDQHNEHRAWKAKQHWNFHFVRNFVICDQKWWICPSLSISLMIRCRGWHNLTQAQRILLYLLLLAFSSL